MGLFTLEIESCEPYIHTVSHEIVSPQINDVQILTNEEVLSNFAEIKLSMAYFFLNSAAPLPILFHEQ